MTRARTFLHALLALTCATPLSAQGVAASPDTSPFAPDTVLAAAGGARVVVIRGPDPALSALRLSVPFVERPDEAGIGRILRDLALEKVTALARPYGARVDVEHTPWGLAYSAAGASEDFEILAWLLREGAGAPDVGGPAFTRARAALREEAARREETPLGRLVSDLRARVAPEAAPEAPGTEAVDAIDPGAVLASWRHTHQTSSMTLVVSTPVALEVVLAGVQGLGSPPLPGPASTNRLPAQPPPKVETLRAWYGEAFAAGADGDPTAAVAARLVAHTLADQAGPWETSVQLWETPGRSVLVVLGATYPRNEAGMRSALGSALTATAEALDPDAVRGAAETVRGALLAEARTPPGLVAVVGRVYEAGGSSAALDARLEALAEVDVAAMRAFLTGLAARGPVRAEVRP